MKKQIIPYQPHLKELARQLRNNSTIGEAILWKYLKGKQMMGYDFDRQKPLIHYIADFYSWQLKLIIEIDGEYHNSEEVFSKDELRDATLQEHGIKVLRFSEKDVRHNIKQVLQIIENYILDFQEK